MGPNILNILNRCKKAVCSNGKTYQYCENIMILTEVPEKPNRKNIQLKVPET